MGSLLSPSYPPQTSYRSRAPPSQTQNPINALDKQSETQIKMSLNDTSTNLCIDVDKIYAVLIRYGHTCIIKTELCSGDISWCGQKSCINMKKY